jgi:acyl carrier protein
VDHKLHDVVKRVLKISTEELADESAFNSLGYWNSLQHVQLVAAVEDVYGIQLSPREIRTFRTVGGLRQILSDKGIVI